MKLKITIIGPKVHDVEYRPYLAELAIRSALRGFEVYNDLEEGQQAVIALLEGDEQRVTRFYESATKERPILASVSDVKSEDYSGEIMPTWQYATMNTSTQINKAIPILLEMRDDIKEMKGDMKAVKANTEPIPQIHEEIKGLREDVQPGFGV